MSIEKLVEECARALCEATSGPFEMLTPEGQRACRHEASAVIRRTLEYAAGEALQFMAQNVEAATRAKIRAAKARRLGDVFGHGETAEIGALECDAAAKEAEAIAAKFKVLARSLPKAEGERGTTPPKSE